MQVQPQRVYEIRLTGEQLMAVVRALDSATFAGLDAARLVLETAAALQRATEQPATPTEQ